MVSDVDEDGRHGANRQDELLVSLACQDGPLLPHKVPHLHWRLLAATVPEDVIVRARELHERVHQQRRRWVLNHLVLGRPARCLLTNTARAERVAGQVRGARVFRRLRYLQIFKANISSSEKPARFSTSPTSSAGFGRPPKFGIEKSSKKPSCAVPEREVTEPGRNTGPSTKASQLVESRRTAPQLIFGDPRVCWNE